MSNYSISPPINGICAVIVTYFPCWQALRAQLDSLVSQVHGIVIVDNTPENNSIHELTTTPYVDLVHVIHLGENQGLGKAQNIGIQWARTHLAGFHSILLMDQDSLPAEDMVLQLVRARNLMQDKGYQVGAVGPRYTDPRLINPPPFIQLQGFKLKRHACRSSEDIVLVDYLIASGSLIALETLAVAGDMHEELFIDYIDIEWGIRARQKGFKHFGVCSAWMQHALGDSAISFGRHRTALHSPQRHYYHFRNAIWLYQQSFIPWRWKCVDASRLLLRYVFFLLFASHRIERLCKVNLGIWHGMRKQLGHIR